VGGRDNKVSFWKATCGTLSTTVILPTKRAQKLASRRSTIVVDAKRRKSLVDSTTNSTPSKGYSVPPENLVHISDMKFLALGG
jgi:hypothetical protein